MSVNRVDKRPYLATTQYGPGWAGMSVDSDDGSFTWNPDGTLRTVMDLTSTQTISGTKTFSGTVVMSGAVTKTEFADGTAAAPSVTFSDDLNTGIYRVGTDSIGISAGGTIRVGVTTGGIDFSASTPASHPILFTGMTLADDCNLIRGIGVNPKRSSGWTSFTGTVAATPAAVYSDYRELHTTGVAAVLGFGSFPYMDAGSSCDSMFAQQNITYVSTGATVLTAGGVSAIGIFPTYNKCVLDGETFNSGGVAAAGFFSVQANTTDVSTQNVSIFNVENASGTIKDIFYFKATASLGWTNFFTFAAETTPILDWGADAANCSGAPTKGIRCKVGTTEYWIPLYVNTP